MEKKELHLLFCTDGIYPLKVGGIQRHSRLLIEYLSGYDNLRITVIHPHEEETIFAGLPNIKEVHVRDINPDKNYLIELFNYSKQVSKVIDNVNPDVIYAQGFTVWHNIAQYSNKLIINPHGLEPWQAISVKDKLIGFPFRLVQKYLFRRAKFTVALGGKLTDILKTIIPEKKILVLPNAVEKPEKLRNKPFPSPDTSETVKILFVGRFASNKGIHLLMDVISSLNSDGYDKKLEFHLAGKGPLYEEYRNRYNFENIKFWGFVSDKQLEELYQTSHLFVLPTLFEGMPTVVLEAMSQQIPIIVTDIGATAEQVDSKNGFLIEKNNRKALKDALIRFYQLPADQKKQMGIQSHNRVLEKFTWQKVAENHHEVFRRFF